MQKDPLAFVLDNMQAQAFPGRSAELRASLPLGPVIAHAEPVSISVLRAPTKPKPRWTDEELAAECKRQVELGDAPEREYTNVWVANEVQPLLSGEAIAKHFQQVPVYVSPKSLLDCVPTVEGQAQALANWTLDVADQSMATATNPLDIVNYLKNAGVEVTTSGHPNYPDTAVSFEETRQQIAQRHHSALAISEPMDESEAEAALAKILERLRAVVEEAFETTSYKPAP